MIKLKKDSLFGQWLKLGYEHDRPSNGCELFWTMLKALGTSALIVILAFVLALIIVSMLLVFFYPNGILFSFAATGYLFLAWAGLYVFKNEVFDPWNRERKIKLIEREIQSATEPKQPNVLVSLYKASKEKICPLVEWE